jgi:hypothetical protein
VSAAQAPETPRERRSQLAAALRAPMPARFHWNFDCILDKDECGSVGCALGLASLLWNAPAVCNERFWGLSWEAYSTIFYGLGDAYIGIANSKITPQMVAAALEETL